MDQWSNFISMMIKHLFGNIAPVHLLGLFGHCAAVQKMVSDIRKYKKSPICVLKTMLELATVHSGQKGLKDG